MSIAKKIEHASPEADDDIADAVRRCPELGAPGVRMLRRIREAAQAGGGSARLDLGQLAEAAGVSLNWAERMRDGLIYRGFVAKSYDALRGMYLYVPAARRNDNMIARATRIADE